MTTHDLARMLTHLRDGFGSGLKNDAVKDMSEAADAFLAMPDKSLRDIVKDLQKAGGSADALIQQILAAKEAGGPADAILALVQKLKLPDLKAVVKALNQPVKKTLKDNRDLIQAFLRSESPAPAETNGSHDDTLAAYRLYCDLRDTPNLTIDDLRARFAPLRDARKPILIALAEKLGYSSGGSADDIADRLQQTLEGLCVSRVRAELIGAGH